jgi:hypothetical protein
MSDEKILPDAITNAIPSAILKLTNSASWESQQSVKNGIELWIESSWNIAKNLGLEPEDYVEWMMLGEWNLAGSGETLSTISSYTSLAGRESWALKKANISIEAALDMAVEEGLETVIDNAKIMTSLSNLFPTDSPIEESKPKQTQQNNGSDFKIDFPQV